MSRDKFERSLSLRILMRILRLVLKINGWLMMCVYFTQVNKSVRQRAC